MAELPVEQARSGSLFDEFYPGSCNPVADFVWYDPYSKEFPTAFEACYGARTLSPGGRDLPTEFVFLEDAGMS